MEHRLKTLPEYFCEVASGRKSFEVRKDDREPPFAPGDTLLLEEYIEGKYTGRWIQADVTLVLRNEYCKEGYCVMAVVPTGGNGLRPTTRADSLRAMSDEELAEDRVRYLGIEHQWNGDRDCWDGDFDGFAYSAEEATRLELDWLSQPAEEN